MLTPEQTDPILASLQSTDLRGPALRKLAMQLLNELPTYNWSGIYRLEGDALVLDEYVGATTDHTRIQVGVGVCGTAVKEDANQVIDDVRELSNYLACSIQTRSEIVVLIRHEGVILGQIDIDGHTVGAFDQTDEAFLEQVANHVALHWA